MFCFIFQGKVPVSPQQTYTIWCEILAPIFRRFTLRDPFLCHLSYTLLSPRGWRGQILAGQMELWERWAGHMQVVRRVSPWQVASGGDQGTQLCLPVSWRWSPTCLRMQMTCCLTVELNGCLKAFNRDFPGGPVVKTPCSACQGPRLNPRSATKILQTTWCVQGHGESGGVLTRLLYLHDIANQLYLWFSNSTSYLYMPEQNAVLP